MNLQEENPNLIILLRNRIIFLKKENADLIFQNKKERIFKIKFKSDFCEISFKK